MTANILKDYDVKNGVIMSPGKFEGESAYVPYFWDVALDGFADEDYTDSTGAVYAFDISDEDKKFFPELKNWKKTATSPRTSIRNAKPTSRNSPTNSSRKSKMRWW